MKKNTPQKQCAMFVHTSGKILFLFLIIFSFNTHAQCPEIIYYDNFNTNIYLNYGMLGGIYPEYIAQGCNPLGAGEEKVVKFNPPGSGNYELQISSSQSSNIYTFGVPFNVYLRQSNGQCDIVNYVCELPYFNNYYFGGVTSKYLINVPQSGVTYDLLIDGVDGAFWGSVYFNLKCGGPTDITLGNVTTTQATINFSCNCPNSAYVEYGPPGFNPGTGATAGGGTLLTNVTSPVTLTGLSAYTMYDVYIRTNCGGAFSDNKLITVRTQYNCAAATVLQCGSMFEYANNVDGIYGNWQNYGCGPTNNNAVEKIFRFTPTVSGMYSVNYCGLICSAIQTSFYYKDASGPCDATGWNCIGNFGTSLMPPATLNWGPLTAGVTYLLLADGYYNGGWYNKFFTLGCANVCPTPQMESITQASATSVNINAPNSCCNTCMGNNITLEYGPPGFTPGTGASAGNAGTVISGLSSFPYTLSGLSSGNSYDIYIRNNCGSSSGFSANSAVISFTLCSKAPAYVNITPAGPYCSGNNVTLTQSNGILAPGATYHWYANSCGSIPIGIGPSITVSPTATTTYYVRAESACGNTVCASATVTISPAASITASGPTTFCAPGSVNLYVNGPGSTYLWRMNGINMPGATSYYLYVSESGVYDCIVTNTCGSAISNAITVTANTLPQPVVSPGSPVTFCAPGSVVLNTSTAAGQTYQWRLNDNNITGATSPSYTSSTTGMYKCFVTNVCGNSQSNPIYVRADVVPSAVATAAGPTTFCQNSSVALNVSACLGCTYQWKKDGVNISGGTNASRSVNTSGNYNCVITNACGSFASNTIAVTVIAPPPASISASGATALCSPATVTLNANTGAGLTYQWKKNGTSIAGATSSSYTASTAGSYNCWVTNSCYTSLSNVIVVSVYATPAVNITAPWATSICFPGTITLYSYTSSPEITRQWRLNGVNIPGATSTNYIASASGNYDCVATNLCGVVTSNAIAISILPLPATPGNITGQTTLVCSSTLTYSINPVAGATSYTWSVSSGASISSGQGTTSVTIAFPVSFGSGSISVVALNSCGTSSSSSLVVAGVPAQPGNIFGPASVCHNQNNVNYSIPTVTGATSYTWTVPPGAQIKSGQGTTLLKVRFGNSAGNITVRANNSCGQGPIRTLAIAMPCRDGEEISINDFDVTLYPNPASDKLSVFCNRLSGNESLLLFSAVGELIFKSELKNQQSEIDIHMLPDGMYFAEIISGEQKKIVKFIKQE